MLPMDFSTVLQCFGSPLPVFDTLGRYVDGIWMESEPVRRKASIAAVVLGMKPDDLEFYGHGELSLGGIAVHTAATLHFTDMALAFPDESDPGAPSQAFSTHGEGLVVEAAKPCVGSAHTRQGLPDPAFGLPDPERGRMQRQSYVEYQRRRYRVAGSGLLCGNATSRLYHCVRYIA